MSDGSGINWTDATWNPITGCSVVSAGCKNCYAMKLAGGKMKDHPSRIGLTQIVNRSPVWNGEMRFNEGWLNQPLQWQRPRKIFVCAHSDLFHENIPDAWIDRVFAVMGNAFCAGREHVFQVLTKRAQRMNDYLNNPATLGRITAAMKDMGLDLPGENCPPTWPLPNVWMGVSVENQLAAEQRVPLLLNSPAIIRWVSAEPLLGEVDLTAIACENGAVDALRGLHRNGESAVPKIDWLVVGGESGSGARPMATAWARSLRDQCLSAGTALLFKQWGEFAPYNRDMANVGSPAATARGYAPPDVMVDSCHMQKIGVKLAGRLLDKQLFDGYPSPELIANRRDRISFANIHGCVDLCIEDRKNHTEHLSA